MNYRLMKVFDCIDMPEKLRREFYDTWDNKGNDSSVEWTIADSIDPDPITQRIDDWLIQNGAEPAKSEESSGECVIILYRW